MALRRPSHGVLPIALALSMTLVALLPYAAPHVTSPVRRDLQPAGTPAASAFSFTTVDSGGTGPELNLGVTSNGFIFVGGWNSVRRSTDDGATWQGLSVSHVLAADRVLIVDHDTDRVLLDDTTLGCTILAWSDDYGASWTQNPAACGAGATDHQKVGVGKRTTLADPTGLLYRNVVYVCANGLSHGNCGMSVDGGLTFLTAAPHGIGCAFQGAPVSDATGVLYEPTTQCGAQVRSTADNGRSWTVRAIPFPASRDTPDMAVTPDGTLYFFYTTDQWKPAFVRSTDAGAHWSGPFLLPVTGLTSAVFPSIVAGDDGRVAFTFYGTADGPGGWDLNPGNAPATVRWNGYVAIVTDAAAAQPTLAPVQVTSDPLQIGCLSKLGSCLNNIADYMDVDVGPDGRVYSVFVDGCPAGCTTAAQSTDDRAIVVIQTDGADLKA